MFQSTELFSPIILVAVTVVFLLFIAKYSFSSRKTPSPAAGFPKSYPIIGSYLDIAKHRSNFTQWTSDLLQISPSSTFVLHRPFGIRTVITANPATVQRILKTHFHIYGKGSLFRTTLQDLLGDGIFNTDADNWKFQRQVASHEFNTKSLRNFVENVVDSEISDRLAPVLARVAASGKVLDFQDILQRFAFDNICKIAFGFDPAYLLPSLPEAKFAQAFETSVRISSERFGAMFPGVWKLKRLLGVGSEKRLKIAVSEVRDFAKTIIKQKKKELEEKSSPESVDLLSRFLSSGHSDETFVTDIIISFILAGRDTTSAALTWFFWLISRHPEVEHEIVNEIRAKSETPIFEEVKDMPYTHAALFESMRLYPPVPMDTKEALSDDVLEDGTVVRKGMRISYHPYAMGRSEKLWGPDWAEFRPERWLKKDGTAEKWVFVAKDTYTYPVFQAGPRICLGKEMALLQMKRIVLSVMGSYRVVPTVRKESVEPTTAETDGDVDPVFLTYLSAKMKGGFPVVIEERRE